MLMSIASKIGVSNFMGYLKGRSALMMFCKHANPKYKFEKRYFWAESYYVSTVELNEATIKKEIQEQEKHNIAMDRLSLKEGEYLSRDSGKWCKRLFGRIVTSQEQWGLNEVKASVFWRWLVMWADIPGTNVLLDEGHYFGAITSNPPMYGRSTSGIVTEPSSFW